MADATQPDHPPAMYVDLITHGLYIAQDPATIQKMKTVPGLFHVSDLSGRLWAQGSDLESVISKAWQKWQVRQRTGGKKVQQKYRGRFEQPSKRRW